MDRTTNAPDVLHPGSLNSVTLVVKKPEAGPWTIRIFGAGVPPSGERVGFSVSQIPQSDFGPIAYAAAVPDRGVAPLAIQFDTTDSALQGATVTAFRWNFGDCSPASTTKAPSHVFTSAGTYAVSVTVTDSNGQTDTADNTIVVTAYNHAPTATFLWGIIEPSRPTFVGLSAQPSTDVDGKITSYAWTFGDGSTGGGQVAFHEYPNAGTYRASLIVTDDGGLTAMGVPRWSRRGWLSARTPRARRRSGFVQLLSAAVKTSALLACVALVLAGCGGPQAASPASPSAAVASDSPSPSESPSPSGLAGRPAGPEAHLHHLAGASRSPGLDARRERGSASWTWPILSTHPRCAS